MDNLHNSSCYNSHYRISSILLRHHSQGIPLISRARPSRRKSPTDRKQHDFRRRIGTLS